MNILAWIIFGALVGWLASIVAGTNARMGAIANIGVGIVGTMVGGFIASLFGIDISAGFNLVALLVAIGGGVLLLSLAKMFSREA